MIGSRRSLMICSRPMITPMAIALIDPSEKPISTRMRLMPAWRKISPDWIIGIAVSSTRVGGGIRYGLKRKYDKICQIEKKIASEITIIMGVRKACSCLDLKLGNQLLSD